MGLEIKPVISSRDRTAFIKLPWRLYRDDPQWIPPLIGDQKKCLHPRKGLFFRYGEARLFIAYRDGKPVGRISAQINRRHDETYGDGKGFFGFFECEDNLETSRALFDAAEDYLRAHHRLLVEGPLSFSIYDEIAILTEGFETVPYLLTTYNPPYYQRLIEDAGYQKSVDWYAFRGTRGKTDIDLPKRYGKLRDRILKREGITFRTMDAKNHFYRDAAIVRDIFVRAWDRNWGHVPMTDAEWARVCALIKMVIVPELSVFSEVNGRPVGFALCVYDVNPLLKQINGRLFPFGIFRLLTGVKKAKRFRLILMGMLEEYRGKGYEAAFYLHVTERGAAMGFEEAEMSLVVETNEPMLRSLQQLPGVERYKSYRLFHKTLSTATPPP